MPDDLLDLAFLLQVGERATGQAAVDLEAVDQHRDGDEPVRLNVLVEFVAGGFVKHDGMVGFVLDCGAGSGLVKKIF